MEFMLLEGKPAVVVLYVHVAPLLTLKPMPTVEVAASLVPLDEDVMNFMLLEGKPLAVPLVVHVLPLSMLKSMAEGEAAASVVPSDENVMEVNPRVPPPAGGLPLRAIHVTPLSVLV